MTIKVQAIRRGYFGGVIREEGDVFEIDNKKQFSQRWMKEIKAPAKSKAPAGDDAGVDAAPAGDAGSGDVHDA